MGDVAYDHYAYRDEHEEAYCVEDVSGSNDSRENDPGEHEGREEDRLDPNYRGCHLTEEQQRQHDR